MKVKRIKSASDQLFKFQLFNMMLLCERYVDPRVQLADFGKEDLGIVTIILIQVNSRDLWDWLTVRKIALYERIYL